MLAESFISCDSSPALWCGVAIAILAALVGARRQLSAPVATQAALACGAMLLALGAGGLRWAGSTPREVRVMVDLSPSTRTATYRDRALLERRIRQLLGDNPYRVEFFSSGLAKVDPAATHLSDVPADKTVFPVPSGAATVLLFSDCRFEVPQQTPPTYVVVDPALDEVQDAAVANIEIRGNDAGITVSNSGTAPRRLALHGIGASPVGAPPGSMVIHRTLDQKQGNISAELSAGDAWPENDALTAIVPPPAEAERWWVGTSAPPAGWRGIAPGDLPTDSGAYLAPAVIALDNIAARDLGNIAQQRLLQYVRELGGTVLVLGGDRAFAAGGYQGTALDALSPLAGTPPLPTTHWVLLMDASGSMSADAAGSTKWLYITDAATRLLPRLPPEDVVTIGSFSQKLDWWAQGVPARQAASMALPPNSAFPHGPTNLQPALEAIARTSDGAMPMQLLVMSDFDTEITNASALAESLQSKNIHLHLLAIGEGSALADLRQAAARTGGSVISQFNPRQWAAAAQELARSASPTLLQKAKITVRFTGDLQSLGLFAAQPWNRVWLKESAAKLAETTSGQKILPMGARWNVGEGRVAAFAFEMPADQVDAVAASIARPPRDPRYRVTWESGPKLHVRVDGMDGATYLDGQRPTLELTIRGNSSAELIPQVGPGRYELDVAAPRAPGFGVVRMGGRALDRLAFAGRYAPEFDAIGNDHAAMTDLASRSGGQVVPAAQTTPLEINWPHQPKSLTTYFSLLGALCITFGLIWWKFH